LSLSRLQPRRLLQLTPIIGQLTSGSISNMRVPSRDWGAAALAAATPIAPAAITR